MLTLQTSDPTTHRRLLLNSMDRIVQPAPLQEQLELDAWQSQDTLRRQSVLAG
jgi:hypothetical protein